MLKRKFTSLAVLAALAIVPATRCLANTNADDAVVNHFFSAIRDNDFKAATAHFSVRMKALSPAGLKGSWKQVYTSEEPLVSWKIFQRQNLPKATTNSGYSSS